VGEDAASSTALRGLLEFHVHPEGHPGTVFDLEDHDTGQANQ